MVVFGQSGFIRASVAIIGQKLLYSGKKCFIRANWLFPKKVFVFGQSGCFRGKLVVFLQKCLSSGKVYSILAKRFYSGKGGCIRSKW